MIQNKSLPCNLVNYAVMVALYLLSLPFCLSTGFSYSDDRDNNKSDTKEKDDKGKMDDGDGDSPSEEIIEGGEHLLRQQHQVEEAAKKTRVHE